VFHVPYLTDHPAILPFRRKGFLAEAQVGAGHLLATTFLFAEAREQPEAQALFAGLVAYLASPPAAPAYALQADEVREWVWGSVHGPQPVDYTPFSFS
jgi:hypothetical protein